MSDPDVLGLPRPLRSDIVPERTASRPSGSSSIIGTKTQQLIGRQEYGNNKMVGTKTFQSNGRQKNTAAFG